MRKASVRKLHAQVLTSANKIDREERIRLLLGRDRSRLFFRPFRVACKMTGQTATYSPRTLALGQAVCAAAPSEKL